MNNYRGFLIYNLTYFFSLSTDQPFVPFAKTNKKPPANPKFLRNAIVCIWSTKSKWNKNAVAIQKIARRPAEILAWYPIITNKGKIISKAIAGYNKNPGTPNPSIQLIVPSILNILLYPENKNSAEIRSLPIKSTRLAIQICT